MKNEAEWIKFKTPGGFRHPDTVAHVETLLDEEISEEAFIKSHMRICHSKKRGPSHARHLYRYLIKMEWIKP